MSSLDSFVDILAPLLGVRRGSLSSGGRRPEFADMPSLDENNDFDDDEDDQAHDKKQQQQQRQQPATTPEASSLKASLSLKNKSWLTPCKPSEARLTIVQITDVYTLQNFASLRTMLSTIRQAQGTVDGDPCNKVISMLTGDFLSPYLLSSIDRGSGMMKAIHGTPIDYLTWGNHEADIDHRAVCKHVRDFPGKWINSNMPTHDAMRYQIPYEVIEIAAPDGSHKRRIGLVAVLSNDPKLYKHFKKPGAFGGAKIEDPWETIRKYEELLTDFEECDLVLPLEHVYVPENKRTCEEFDFPIVLSGHDHHRVDFVHRGTRVIKPGMDGVYATVLELTWDGPDKAATPNIRSTFVPVAKFAPCPQLQRQCEQAYKVLDPLRHTELAAVPAQYRPLSSKNARAEVCTMGRLICSMLKSSLEMTLDEQTLDAVILMGGNIRGGEDYPSDSFFSLETLEAEIKADEVIGVVPIPGHVLAEGIVVTHAGDPIPGWMQYDDGIQEDMMADGKTSRVTRVAGQPLDPYRIYRVATKISDLTNGQSPPLKAYFTEHRDLLPAKGDYINVQKELMGFFARNLWRRLWEAIGDRIPDAEEMLDAAKQNPKLETIEKVDSRLRLDVLDRDGSGIVTVDDIHVGLRDFLGLSVDNTEKTLAKHVHSIADATDNGKVTKHDFELFCLSVPPDFKPIARKWSDAFPEPGASPAVSRASSPKPDAVAAKAIDDAPEEDDTLMF